MVLSISTLLLSLFVPVLVLSIALIITFRSSEDRENCSPFECGFDPNNNARIPFSMRFFLLAVIFLVFDIEIVLLMPAPLLLNSFFTSAAAITLLIFFFILILGLLHEWREGSLDWSILE